MKCPKYEEFFGITTHALESAWNGGGAIVVVGRYIAQPDMQYAKPSTTGIDTVDCHTTTTTALGYPPHVSPRPQSTSTALEYTEILHSTGATCLVTLYDICWD